MGPTETLARFAVSTNFKDLPPEVVKKAKETILDTLGCGLGGYKLAPETSQPILSLVRDLGGQPESTVIAAGFKTSCALASLANSTIVHSIDFDDTHLPSIAHIGSCTVPVALAMGEKVGASGAEVIAAVVLGFEVAGRVGRSVMPTHYDSWHSTGTNGTLGAAAVAGKLLGLDAKGMEVALGLAADQAAGGRYCLDYGDFSKSLHPGMASLKGVMAALLAGKGTTGPLGILEYPTGYCQVYSKEPDLAKLTQGLGKPFEIMVNDVKAFPTILCSHTPAQAILGLVKEHNLAVEAIDKIEIRMTALAKGQGLNYHPETPLGARLSIPYCSALAAAESTVTLAQFEPGRLHDPKLQELMARVVVTPDPEINRQYPDTIAAFVDIVARDGKTYSRSSIYPKGSAKNPMSPEELQEKFLDLAGASLNQSRARQMAQIVGRLEEETSLDRLMALLAGPAK